VGGDALGSLLQFPPQSGTHSLLVFALVHHHTHSVVLLKPTVSHRPSVPPNGSQVPQIRPLAGTVHCKVFLFTYLSVSWLPRVRSFPDPKLVSRMGYVYLFSTLWHWQNTVWISLPFPESSMSSSSSWVSSPMVCIIKTHIKHITNSRCRRHCSVAAAVSRLSLTYSCNSCK